MLEERHFVDFYTPFLHATDTGYVLVATAGADTRVLRFATDGTLLNEDTLATNRVFYSFFENGAIRLVTIEHEWFGGPDRIVATIFTLDSEGQLLDSLLLMDAVMNDDEFVVGARFDYSYGVLRCVVRAYSETAQGTDQRFWLATYDGNGAVQGQPYGPFAIRSGCFLWSWNVCGTPDGQTILVYNRYCTSESQLRISELPLDGNAENPPFVLPLASAQRVNTVELAEVERSVVCMLTVEATMNTYSGAYITAIPLSEILDSPEPRPELPDFLHLSAYPNPFNAATTISFVLPTNGKATLTAYDVTGRKVAQLAEGTYAAGQHEVQWQPSNLASGKYFCRLETAAESRVIPVILIK